MTRVDALQSIHEGVSVTTVDEASGTSDLGRLIRGPIVDRVCRTPPDGVTPAAWYERWFPDTYRFTAGEQKGQYTDAAAFAVALCHMCPFVVSCRMGAVAAEGDAPASDRYGIFGAMDPEDRWGLMVEMNGGKPPTNRRYSPPSEESAPLRRLILDAIQPDEAPSALDARIADAVGISQDTVQMIRTGARPRVRLATFLAIKSWFERGGAA